MRLLQEKRPTRTYQNLPAVIADELREAILNGEIQAGEKLKQEDIAKRFNSSLIPAREALRTLETEGLVTFYPNKGAFVSALSLEKVKEIFETRIYIEMGALECSVPNLTPEDFEEAERILSWMDSDATGKNLSEHNRMFHNLLYGGCGNRFLMELVGTLHRNIERYMRPYLADHGNNDRSQDTHRKILQAAREKNAPQAKAYLESHMRAALEDLIAALAREERP